MAAKTYHVYPSDGIWFVKQQGANAKTFRTRREAIKAGRKYVKNAASGQLVVHGRDGSVRQHESYGMTRIQNPPKKSRLAKRIGRAVGRVALERLKSDSHTPSVIASEK